MPLIACPECRAHVSDRAPACPKCGFPLDRRPPPHRRQGTEAPPGKERLQQPQGKSSGVGIILLCIGIPFGIILLLVGGILLFNVLERSGNRSQAFTSIHQATLAEDALLGAERNPKAIARFRSKRAGNLVRIGLELNEPYEFRAEAPGKNWYVPDVELSVLRDMDDRPIARTSEIDVQYVPSMPPIMTPPRSDPAWKDHAYRRKGIPSKILLEFTPTDEGDYRIEFRGPAKGFRKYKVLVEQKGL